MTPLFTSWYCEACESSERAKQRWGKSEARDYWVMELVHNTRTGNIHLPKWVPVNAAKTVLTEDSIGTRCGDKGCSNPAHYRRRLIDYSNSSKYMGALTLCGPFSSGLGSPGTLNAPMNQFDAVVMVFLNNRFSLNCHLYFYDPALT